MTDKPEDELEIVVEAEKPGADTTIEAKPNGAETAVAAKAPVVEPDAAIEKLRADLASERAARAEAERRATAAEQGTVRAQTEAQKSDLQLVTGAIDTVKLTDENLKRAYADAASAGDWETAANVQSEMAKNAAKLIQLEQGKAALEEAPKPVARPAVTDQVEQIARSLSPKSADWVRTHPQYITDARLNRRLLAAHNLAETDGHALDSPEYFAAVEGTLGLSTPGDRPLSVALETDDNPLSAASDRAPDRTPAAAPPSRGGGGKRVVRLTPAEVEAAELSGMTAAEYAAQKDRIDREKSGQRLN